MRMTYAISRADLVLIPMQKNRLDADMAAQAVREVALEARHQRRKIPFAIAFTKTQAAVERRTARRIAEEVASNPALDVIEVELHEREPFAAMWNLGMPLFELDPMHVNNIDKAIENAMAFTDAVVARFKKANRAAAA